MSAPVFDDFNDLCRLLPRLVGEILVPLLHLLMRDVQLGFARLVRRDLRRRGALSIRFGEVVFNLLTTGAGCFEVLPCVAADLGLAAAPALDLVAKRRQSRASSDRYTAVAYCCVR